MELGSVPTPPRKPKSSIRTQSVRPSRISTTRAGNITRRRPERKARPSSTRATTTNRFTPQPWPRSNEANEETADERACGCGVLDISAAIADSVPGFDVVPPCQNPRPGQACSTAIPSRKTPAEPVMMRPSRGPNQARSGSAISAPATA